MLPFISSALFMKETARHSPVTRRLVTLLVPLPSTPLQQAYQTAAAPMSGCLVPIPLSLDSPANLIYFAIIVSFLLIPKIIFGAMLVCCAGGAG